MRYSTGGLQAQFLTVQKSNHLFCMVQKSNKDHKVKSKPPNFASRRIWESWADYKYCTSARGLTHFKNVLQLLQAAITSRYLHV
jgi:hypothetical protein